MFNRASSKGRYHTCVRLPAGAAFPTDGKLIERIEMSRKALPVDNVKPVRRPVPAFEELRKAS
jgi:hypothetical protein